MSSLISMSFGIHIRHPDVLDL